MKKITDIQIQKKNKDRVSIFINNEFWSGMSMNCFNDLSLKLGQEFTDEDFIKIEQKVAEDSGFSFALKRLSYRQLSEQELKDKMEEREYGSSIIDIVIDKCRENYLLNDERLFELIVESRILKGHGKPKIKEYLNRRKLPRHMVEENLNDLYNLHDEEILVKEVLDKRYKNKMLDRREQEKATAYLIRSGFPFNLAVKAVESVSISESEEAKKHPPDEAIKILTRKYPVPLSVSDKQKAYALLSRKKFVKDVINKAIRECEGN